MRRSAPRWQADASAAYRVSWAAPSGVKLLETGFRIEVLVRVRFRSAFKDVGACRRAYSSECIP